MRVLEGIAELSDVLERGRASGARVGLVPTMGALHDGHASLIERAADECDLVCATVFVNPLQFGAGEDLDRYPRDLDGDLLVAEKAGAAIVFAPTVVTMYPEGARTRVRVDGLGDVLEGLRRPGHFEGVATVVAKLFAITGRCRAYFGEKDWQQLVLLERLAADLCFPVEVVGCPTIRDHDGLALSSRNAYLSAAERRAAPVLHRALLAGVAAIDVGERRASVVEALVADLIGVEPLARVGSVDVVDARSLEPVDPLAGELRILVEAQLGAARLIDNVGAVAP